MSKDGLACLGCGLDADARVVPVVVCESCLARYHERCWDRCACGGRSVFGPIQVAVAGSPIPARRALGAALVLVLVPFVVLALRGEESPGAPPPARLVTREPAATDPAVTLSRQALLSVLARSKDAAETCRFLEKATFFEPLDEAQLGWVEHRLDRGNVRALDELAKRAQTAHVRSPPGKTAVSLGVAEGILAETDEPEDAVHALEDVDFLFPIDEVNLTALAQAAPQGTKGAVVGYLQGRAAARPEERRASRDPKALEGAAQVGALKK